MDLSHLRLPHGITSGELELALVAVVVVALMAISRHAGTIAKLATRAATPAPAPAKTSGGKGKLLLLAGVIGGGVWAYAKTRHPVAAVRAAPAPSPAPASRPKVTPAVTPHVTQAAHHLLAVSGNVVALYAIGAVVAIVIAGQIVRKLL